MIPRCPSRMMAPLIADQGPSLPAWRPSSDNAYPTRARHPNEEVCIHAVSFPKLLPVALVGSLIPLLSLRAQEPPPGKPAPGEAAKTEPRRPRPRPKGARGAHRPDRSDQGRRTEPVAAHGHAELSDRRDRPPAHRLAQPQAGQRVDLPNPDQVGAVQCPSGSLGTVRQGLDAEAVLGPGDRAPMHSPDRVIPRRGPPPPRELSWRLWSISTPRPRPTSPNSRGRSRERSC